MKNEVSGFTIEPTLEVLVTTQDIDDIMCTALEGGITHWCCKAKPVGRRLGVFAHEQISRGGSLILYDAESSDKWELTRDKFLTGFKNWLEAGSSDAGVLIGNEVDTGGIDAECADAIIQFALFGEVVFG